MVGVWVYGGPFRAMYRLEEGLPSEEKAQEADTQMFRYPSQTPGNCPGVSLISTIQRPALNTHVLGVCWESGLGGVNSAARLLELNSGWDVNSSQTLGSLLNLAVFPDLLHEVDNSIKPLSGLL